MRIAISTNADFSESYGTTTRVKVIANVLRERGHVSIIGNITNKTRVIRMVIRTLRLILAVFKNKFDVIYCADDFWGFPFYYILSKIFKYKIIFDVHGILSEERKRLHPPKIQTKIDQIVERIAAAKADYVLTVGENMFRFYYKYNTNICLVPLFVDEEIFKPKRKNPVHQKTCKLVGLIGPFSGWHNPSSLRFIYSNLEKFDKRINFLIIGHCNNKIASDRISYTGHLDSIQDYVDQLCMLDAVLIYKEPATGPYTKVIEAMACGLPVFTTPSAMIGFEKAVPGRDLLVFPEEELVNKVNELIFDEELMVRIGKNARITIEKYYSKTVNKLKLLGIVDSL